MYFEDLSPYTYGRPAAKAAWIVNVGWLDPDHEYARGDVDREAILKLAELCRIRVNQTRGIHPCEFCHREQRYREHCVRFGYEAIWLGGAELRLGPAGGTVYAAPNLIYHYVVHHDYRPPGEFVEALLRWDTAETPFEATNE